MLKNVCRPSSATLDTATVGAVVGELSDPYGWLWDETVVDLSRVRFVRPSGLVALSTYVATAVGHGSAVRVVCPRVAGCCDYLATSGVLQHCAGLDVALDGSGGREAKAPSTNPRVLPVTPILTGRDAGAVWTRVDTLVERVMGATTTDGRQTARAFSSALHEMAANAARYGTRGYVAAQRYKNKWDGKSYVEFAIGDTGPGIKATLGGTYPWAPRVSDAEVLGRMVREGLSSTGGGRGYAVVKDFTSDYGGQFDLRSGTGALSLPRGRRDPIVGETADVWSGTFMAGSITVDG